MKNNEIFEFLKPDENHMISHINNKELQELLYYLNMYYLEFRKSLGFDENVTFGLEIEVSHSRNKYIKKQLQLMNSGWSSIPDGSLHKGIELKSPICSDTNKDWLNVKKVCSVVKKHSIIDGACGGHIHIGTQTIGDKSYAWLNFLKLWSVYENVIYRFVFGSYLGARPNIKNYAFPVSKPFMCNYNSFKERKEFPLMELIQEVSRDGRHQAVNLSNVTNFYETYNKNTIEFRCPNGTMEPIIWQNNVNLFINMLLYSKSDNFNNGIIDKRKEMYNSKFMDLKYYHEIFLDQALEFCDLVFKKNIDKIYFLRQYLKSFETGKGTFEKAKTFVKKS